MMSPAQVTDILNHARKYRDKNDSQYYDAEILSDYWKTTKVISSKNKETYPRNPSCNIVYGKPAIKLMGLIKILFLKDTAVSLLEYLWPHIPSYVIIH